MSEYPSDEVSTFDRAQGQCSVAVEVNVHPGPQCIVAHEEYDVTDLWIYRDGDHFDCDAAVQSRGQDERTPVVFRGCRGGAETCTCTAFDDCDVVPHVQRVEDDSFVVRLHVSDSVCASHVFERLRAEAAGAELLRYRPIGEPECDADDVRNGTPDLTDKQRRALELALEAGYYESPRECTLDVLADAEDISVSAFAKRLRNAERMIVEQFAGGR